MKTKRLLNGYAGLGGNVHLLGDDWEVVSIEKTEKIAAINQELNPNHNVIVGDIRQYMLDHHQEYTHIWLSPPCQKQTKMVKATRHKMTLKTFPDMALYEDIIFLTHFFKGKWVVENVQPYYEPLIKPSAILGRHYIWSNFPISHFDVKRPSGFINKTNTAGANALKEWLGMHYEGNVYYEGNHCPAQVLRNCVHPKLGLHILNESEKHIDDTQMSIPLPPIVTLHR